MFTKKLLSVAVISATALLAGCAEECGEADYQSFDGSCNNVWNADWGKAGNYYEPGPEGTEYAIDGLSPKQTINERFISNELMANNDGVTQLSDTGLSQTVLWMGQFVTHDFSRINVDFSHPYYQETIPTLLTMGDRLFGTTNTPDRTAAIAEAEALIVQNGAPGVLIPNPEEDELATIARSFNPLLPYTGTIPYPILLLPEALYEKPIFGDKRIKNFINAWLDLSQVYGDTKEINDSLRTGQGGMLKTIDKVVDTEYRPLESFQVTLHDVLPTSDMVAHAPSEDPVRPFDPANEFSAGDVRASENYSLTALHMAFHRYHNQVAAAAPYQLADQLAEIPVAEHDEFIFQQTRRFVIAVYQHILFNEYLPALLGSHYDNLIGDYEGYDPSIKPETNPSMVNAAFRYAHSALPMDVIVRDQDGNEVIDEELRNEIYVKQFGQTTVPGLGQTGPAAPFTIVNHVAVLGGFDDIIRTMTINPTTKVDLVYEDSVRNVVAAQSLANAGIDLATIDIFRAREFGIPNFNKLRKHYGLGSVYDGKDGCRYKLLAKQDDLACFLKITSDVETAEKLQAVYKRVHKVDGIVGLLAEDHLPGSSLSLTAAALIADDFKRKRDADRFWYENIMTPELINVVESVSMADILAQTACGIGQPNCVVTKEELDPTNNTVFRVPEDRVDETVEFGACKYTSFSQYTGPRTQCDEPYNKYACDVQGGEFIPGASAYKTTLCPQEDRIGTCVFSFIHMRSRFYGDSDAAITEWECRNELAGFWVEGNARFLDVINAAGGRIDNEISPTPFPGSEGNGFCEYTQSSPAGDFQVCQTQLNEDSCATNSGTFNSFGCAAEGIVGTCTLPSGSALNYYTGDAAGLETGCGFQGGTWTAGNGGGDNGGGDNGGGGEPSGSCAYTQSSPGGDFSVCQEPVLASACAANNGTFDIVNACDVSAIVGTCTLADGSAINYNDGDAAGLETGCGFQGGTWTAGGGDNGGGDTGGGDNGGGSEPSGSCVYLQSSPGGSFNVCQEPVLASACVANSGAFDPVNACDTSAIVGTCTLADGSAVNYFDGDAAGLETGCGFQGGTWESAVTDPVDPDPEEPVEPEVGACFYTQSSPGGTFDVCHSEQNSASCGSFSGTLAGGECPTATSIGFCTIDSGAIYYYDGSASSLSIGCGFQGGSWTTL